MFYYSLNGARKTYGNTKLLTRNSIYIDIHLCADLYTTVYEWATFKTSIEIQFLPDVKTNTYLIPENSLKLKIPIMLFTGV